MFLVCLFFSLCFVSCHNNHILSSLSVYLFLIHNMTWHLIVSLSAQSLSLFSFALWTHNNRHKNSQTTEYYFRFGRVLWSMAASLHAVSQTRHMLSMLAAQWSNNCSRVDTVYVWGLHVLIPPFFCTSQTVPAATCYDKIFCHVSQSWLCFMTGILVPIAL